VVPTVGVARMVAWPPTGTGVPPAGRFAYLAGAAADAPPPFPAGCAACLLPPTGAAHPAVARLRRWLDAAAAAAESPLCVYRPEAVPGDPQRHRLAVSFAHVCTVLGVPAAVEVPPGPVGADHPLADVLRRWPAVAVAVAAPDAVGVAATALLWGARLALAVVPAGQAEAACAAWTAAVPGAGGWVLAADGDGLALPP